MEESHCLSDFEAADEDHLDLLFGFDNHALEYVSCSRRIGLPQAGQTTGTFSR